MKPRVWTSRFGGVALINFCSILPILGWACSAGAIVRATPESVGMEGKQLRLIGPDLESARLNRVARDLSVAIVKDGKLVYSKSVGSATERSLYDLASLTKPIATGMAIMKLAEEGLLRLDEPVATYLPGFENCRFGFEIIDGKPVRKAAPVIMRAPPVQLPLVSTLKPEDVITFPAGPMVTKKPEFALLASSTGEVPPEWIEAYCEPKKKITVEMLLRHRSGMRDIVFRHYLRQAIDKKVNPYLLYVEAPMLGPPLEYRYADINFVILRVLIEVVLAPQNIGAEDWLRKNIFLPIGMKDTVFEFSADQKKRVLRAVSPNVKGTHPWYLPHDPIAQAFKGYSGNAGLFSSLLDLAEFASRIGTDQFPIRPDTTLQMTCSVDRVEGECIEGVVRGLGWDISSPHTDPFHSRFKSGFGHTGFTGTSIWIDPKRELSVILLTNRTYYRGEHASADPITALRRKVADRVMKALGED